MKIYTIYYCFLWFLCNSNCLLSQRQCVNIWRCKSLTYGNQGFTSLLTREEHQDIFVSCGCALARRAWFLWALVHIMISYNSSQLQQGNLFAPCHNDRHLYSLIFSLNCTDRKIQVQIHCYWNDVFSATQSNESHQLSFYEWDRISRETSLTLFVSVSKKMHVMLT